MMAHARRKKFLTLDEAVEECANDDDFDTIIIHPPESNGNITEEEEDIMEHNDGKGPNDVSGTLELSQSSKLRRHDSCKESGDVEESTTSSVMPAQEKRKTRPKRKWYEGDVRLDNSGIVQEMDKFVDQYPLLKNQSPLEIFKLYFDSEVEEMFVNYTNKYASEIKNEKNFDFNREDLWRFIIIVTISCYNERPRYRLFWSKDEDVACPLIPQLMSRNRFEQVKRMLDVCDNIALDLNDKWCKLRPFISLANSKLKQFGVSSKYVSIDEQIDPYFGHHRSKMFHRDKPIRFGFQNWIMAGDDGAPIHFEPYQGRTPTSETVDPLGTRVVNLCVNELENPEQHIVFFDNLFCSLPLLEDLKKRNIKATGTLRANRLQDCQLPSVKEFMKKERGTFQSASTKDLCVTRYKDSSVVTIASNHEGKNTRKYDIQFFQNQND